MTHLRLKCLRRWQRCGQRWTPFRWSRWPPDPEPSRPVSRSFRTWKIFSSWFLLRWTRSLIQTINDRIQDLWMVRCAVGLTQFNVCAMLLQLGNTDTAAVYRTKHTHNKTFCVVVDPETGEARKADRDRISKHISKRQWHRIGRLKPPLCRMCGGVTPQQTTTHENDREWTIIKCFRLPFAVHIYIHVLADAITHVLYLECRYCFDFLVYIYIGTGGMYIE